MSKKSPGSYLKQQDSKKGVKGQSTEELEKKLRTLELRRAVLQNNYPVICAPMTKQGGESWVDKIGLVPIFETNS